MTVLVGLASVALGIGIYKLNKMAFWLTLSLGIIMAIGAYMSFSQ